MKLAIQLSALLFLQTLFLVPFAQNRITDTSATCIAFWKNGEVRVLQITHGKEKYDSSKLKSKTTVTYEAHIKIIDSAASGYTIEWVYKNFRSSDINDQLSGGINTIMEGLKILYKTDDIGSFSELINWKEVRDFAFNSFEQVLDSNSGNKTVTSALNEVKAMFHSKENIEAVMIKEIQLYHTPYGVEYYKSELIQQTALPNITGGSPMPAKISYKIIELDPKKDFCRVYQKQTIDKGIAGPIIADMLKKLSGDKIQNEVDIKKEIEDIEISDINEFCFALGSGWLSSIFFKRISNVANFKQIESYEISVL